MNKRILFLTGTRADFGKLKPLINIIKESPGFDYQIFVTGIHLMKKYGQTVNEISKSGFEHIFTYMNQVDGEGMDVILANTITGLSRYLHENDFDLIVVHGDRVEALAGATVGALRNTLVAHVEGGEVSGTVDELMRHAVSKMSHLHFVASEIAKKRLIQLGEDPNSIFLIGSPDVDVMLSSSLPSLEQAKKRYEVNFSNYSLAILHPVTTEFDKQQEHARTFVDALLESGENYIIIFPNNDHGSKYIFSEYDRLIESDQFKVFPSLRFEYFLTFLKNASYIVGNSSAGIHEAPVYGVPTINIGSRQYKRMSHSTIYNVNFDKREIIGAIKAVKLTKTHDKSFHYGDGGSALKFLSVLQSDVWTTSNQKYFKDVEVCDD